MAEEQTDNGVILEFPDAFNSRKSAAEETEPLPPSSFLEPPDKVPFPDDEDDTFYQHTVEEYEKAGSLHYDDDEDLYDEEDLPDEEEPQERYTSRNMKFVDILSVDLPTPLQRRALAQYAVAALVVFLCALLSIYYKEIYFMAGIIISGLLVYNAISTTLDFLNGQIEEVPVICCNVNETRVRDRTSVTFRTDEEHPSYFEFNVAGKRANEFHPNMIYMIYYNVNNPRVLLAYAPL